MKASAGAARRSSLRMRSGRSGNCDELHWSAQFDANSLRPRAISSFKRPAIGVTLAARFVGERRQRELRIGAHAELGLIVAADLGEIGVDVNQPRRRNREGEARIPRARVRFGETRADRDDQIGGAALLVGDRRAPETGLAEQQRMLVRQASLPHQRVRDRHLQRFGKLLQFFGRARRQHAAAGIQHRTPRRRQGIDDARGGRGIETRLGDLGRRRSQTHRCRGRPRRCPSARRRARDRDGPVCAR